MFLEFISCVIVAGGLKSGFGVSTVEVLTNERFKKLPNLPGNIDGSTMTLHNGTILICGGWGNKKSCLQLDRGVWNVHSVLKERRFCHSAITTETATFIFGGHYSNTTYEYLPKDSNTWLVGKTEIPGGFWKGCAIASRSEEEIWLIGGLENQRRILSFNTKHHTFQKLESSLNIERYEQRCAFIPNTNQIMITGGGSPSGSPGGEFASTEIFNTQTGNVKTASRMNFRRSEHGIGVIAINGKDSLVVFGGQNNRYEDHDSIEVYNVQKGIWEITNMKLEEPKMAFGFLSVKLNDIKTGL